jgi:hypothetical protein
MPATDPCGCARPDNKRAPSHLAARESRIRSKSVSARSSGRARGLASGHVYAGRAGCCGRWRCVGVARCRRARLPSGFARGLTPGPRLGANRLLARVPGRGICNRFASKQLSQIACGPCPPRPGPPLGPPLGPPTLSPPPLGSPPLGPAPPPASPLAHVADGGSCLHRGTRMMRKYCGWPSRHSGRWSQSHYSCSRTR